MREMTLLETSYLAGLLLLSLVLPLVMSFRAQKNPANARICMDTVWSGQALAALAALAVLASAPVAPYAALFGLVSCVASTIRLLRQFRAARPA